MNATSDEITFSSPDGFQDGEPVVFSATGSSSSGYQGALTDGKQYYVHVISSTTIQLYSAPPGTAGAGAVALSSNDAGALTSNTITFSTPDGFQNGQAVVFTAPGADYRGVLQTGQTYYVKVLSSTAVRLYTKPLDTPGSSVIALDAFDGGSLASNVITFAAADGFVNGEAVVFTATGSSYQGALADGQTYYVNVLGPTTIQLYTAPPGTSGAAVVALNAYDAGTLSTQPTLTAPGFNEQSASFAPAGQSFTAPSLPFTAPTLAFVASQLDTSSGEITFASPDGLEQGQGVVFKTFDLSYQGALVAGQTYYVHVINPTTIQLYTAPQGSPGAALVSLNASDAGFFTSTSYSDIGFSSPDGLQQGQAVVFTATFPSVQGSLVNGQDYYVNVIDPQTIELFTAPPSSAGAVPVMLSASDSGTLTPTNWNDITFSSPDGFQQGQAVALRTAWPRLAGTTQGALVSGDTNMSMWSTCRRSSFDLGVPRHRCQRRRATSYVNLNANDAGTLTTTNWTDITFASPDGFQQGQAVVYTATGSSGAGALTSGQTYYVNVVSPTTMELYGELPSTAGAEPIVLTSNDVGVLSATPSITLPQPTVDQITNVTVAGAVAKNVAVSGSISLNFLQNSAVARISDIGSQQSVKANGSITIEVSDGSQINSGAGGVAVSLGQAAVGAAVSYDQIQNQYQARIGNNSTSPPTGDGGNVGLISAGGAIDVQTISTAQINNVTLAGSASQNAAVSGSASVNQIANTIDAYIAHSVQVVAKGGLDIQAQDHSTIGSGSGQISAAFNLYSRRRPPPWPTTRSRIPSTRRSIPQQSAAAAATSRSRRSRSRPSSPSRPALAGPPWALPAQVSPI